MERIFEKKGWEKSFLGKLFPIFYSNSCFVLLMNTKLKIDMHTTAISRWKDQRSHKLVTGVRVRT